MSPLTRLKFLWRSLLERPNVWAEKCLKNVLKTTGFVTKQLEIVPKSYLKIPFFLAEDVWSHPNFLSTILSFVTTNTTENCHEVSLTTFSFVATNTAGDLTTSCSEYAVLWSLLKNIGYFRSDEFVSLQNSTFPRIKTNSILYSCGIFCV